MNKLGKFLEELDMLSRKHKIWIQVNDTDMVDLIDENYETIAAGLHCDESSQQYLVNEDFREGNR